VLALTQVTAMLADDPSWQGLARGVLILAVLWWTWGGYTWLTSRVDPDAGIVAAAALGVVIAAALWWLYFDVVAPVAEHRLTEAAPGRERNELARDAYAYLHFPMIAGIVLGALGLKKTIEDVGDPLETVTAVALLGGTALYLVAHVAFRLRNLGTVNVQRLVVAVVLVAVVPLGVELPALATVAVVAAVLASLIAYEAVRFAEARDRIRHGTRAARHAAAPADP